MAQFFRSGNVWRRAEGPVFQGKNGFGKLAPGGIGKRSGFEEIFQKGKETDRSESGRKLGADEGDLFFFPRTENQEKDERDKQNNRDGPDQGRGALFSCDERGGGLNLDEIDVVVFLDRKAFVLFGGESGKDLGEGE